jgi:hypothetical protein
MLRYFIKYDSSQLPIKFSVINPDVDVIPTNSIEVSYDTFQATLSTVPSLLTVKAVASDTVDKKAGEVRLRYITSVPGQAETYLMKSTEAKEIKAGGYSNVNLSSYPMIKAEMDATGIQDVAIVCETIIQTELQWKYLAAIVERERRSGKIEIALAGDVTMVYTARDTAVASLEAIGT